MLQLSCSASSTTWSTRWIVLSSSVEQQPANRVGGRVRTHRFELDLAVGEQSCRTIMRYWAMPPGVELPTGFHSVTPRMVVSDAPMREGTKAPVDLVEKV
jgi:hypothetical protein